MTQGIGCDIRRAPHRDPGGQPDADLPCRKLHGGSKPCGGTRLTAASAPFVHILIATGPLLALMRMFVRRKLSAADQSGAAKLIGTPAAKRPLHLPKTLAD